MSNDNPHNKHGLDQALWSEERLTLVLATTQVEHRTAEQQGWHTAKDALDQEFSGSIAHYEIAGEVGRGAMGVVYAARDTLLNRKVAIKRLTGPAHPVVRQRLVREAQAMARVAHPNVAAIFEIREFRGLPFIVMEYIEGATLREWLASAHRSTLEILTVFRAVADGLNAAHEQGLTHRDIKPSNIIVGDDGRVRVMDFGLVKIDDTSLPQAEHDPEALQEHVDASTMTGTLVGTLAYMSPEQLRCDRVGFASDQFSYCVTLYEALFGARPFTEQTLEQQLDAIMTGKISWPTAEPVTRDVPKELVDMVTTGLQAVPERRFASMRDLLHAIDRLMPAFSKEMSVYALENVRDILLNRTQRQARDQMFQDGDQESGRTYILVVEAKLASEWYSALTTAADSRSAKLQVYVVPVRFLQDDRPVLQAEGLPQHHGNQSLVVLGIGRACLGLAEFVAGQVASIYPASPGQGSTSILTYISQIILHGPAPASLELLRTQLGRLASCGLRPPNLSVLAVDIEARPSSEWCREILSRSTSHESLHALVAHQTAIRTYEFARMTRTQVLFNDKMSDDDGADHSQAGVRSALLAEVAKFSADATVSMQRTVLTGIAGVGKTTLLMTIARDLAIEAQRSDALLPMCFLLQKEILDEKELAHLRDRSDVRSASLFAILLKRWCRWLNEELMRQHVVSEDWALRQLFHQNTCLLFDGVDEFCMNNPQIGFNVFRDMLHYLESRNEVGRMFIISVARNSLPRHELLAGKRTHIFEVYPLSQIEACRHWPEVGPLLATVPAEMRQILLTPLLLRWLGPRAHSIAARSLENESLIYAEAMAAIVEESGLNEWRRGNGELATTEQWIDALTVLGWAFHSHAAAEFRIDRMPAEVNAILARWESFRAQHRGDAMLDSTILGFSLASEERAFKVILERTIFTPVGYMVTRLVHREWLEFLAGRYFALCVKTEHLEELQYAGFTHHMYRFAANLLDGYPIEWSFLQQILAKSRETLGVVGGNIFAMLGNGRMVIEPEAISKLLRRSRLAEMHTLDRFVCCGSIGYRTLRKVAGDASAQYLELAFRRLFREYDEMGYDIDPLAASLLWCYHKAMAQRYGYEGPGDRRRCIVGGRREAHDAALDVVTHKLPDGDRKLRVQERLTQVAFLTVQNVMLVDPFRAVSVVHYLYCLTIAAEYGLAIGDVYKEIMVLLENGSMMEKALEKYDAVPELLSIFRYCQELVHSRTK